MGPGLNVMVESKFKPGVVLLKSSFHKHLLEGLGQQEQGCVSRIGSALRPVAISDEGSPGYLQRGVQEVSERKPKALELSRVCLWLSVYKI